MMHTSDYVLMPPDYSTASRGRGARLARLQDDGVKKLVNSGNAEGFAPLHLAAAGGHVAVCRLLIEAGARLDLKHMAEQQTALHLAARNPCGNQPVSSVA